MRELAPSGGWRAGAEHVHEFASIRRRIIAITIVEQHVHFIRVFREMPHTRHPLP